MLDRGDASRVLSTHVRKIGSFLLLLENASGPGDLDSHPLRGDRAEFGPLWVFATWRITFWFRDNNVWDADLVEYQQSRWNLN